MVPIRDISARSDSDVERSCNCCNGNICKSECCCFPFFRRRRHINIESKTIDKINEVAKENLTKAEVRNKV